MVVEHFLYRSETQNYTFFSTLLIKIMSNRIKYTIYAIIYRYIHTYRYTIKICV